MKAKAVNDLMRTAKFTARAIGKRIGKASPEILLTIGIGGVIVGTVMACVASRKLTDILDEHNACRDELEEDGLVTVDENGEPAEDEEETVSSVNKRALWHLYLHTGVKVLRLYAPSVGIVLAAIACILGSHGIMKRRNTALLVAYSALERGFGEYRTRVRQAIGEEAEDRLRFGITEKEIEDHYIDENGEEVNVVKTAPVFNISECSPYARYFDAYSVDGWQGDSAETCLLDGMENYYNQRLYANDGQVVILNNLLHDLGYCEDMAGASAGWAVGVSDEDGIKIRRIKGYREINEDGMTQIIPTTILDFNCLPDVRRYLDRADVLSKQVVN